ncbi:MAG: heme biosynthesis HemY N-terminal domain-containing protein [Pseudomonadota bacterium]
MRLILFLGMLLGGAALATWLADHPGTVSYNWLGERGTIDTTEAAALAAGASLGLLIVAEIVRSLWRLPTLLRERQRKARKERGWDWLTKGLVAVGAGDGKAAEKAAGQALAKLPSAPAATFLAAQAAQMRGNRASAERYFSALTDDPDTRVLGLRGLAVEAQRAGDHAAALVHAESALAADPNATWAVEAAFAAMAATGEFAKALALLPRAGRAQGLANAAERRLRAVLLTAQALSGDDTSAREHALEAHNLAKDFVPAALAASALAAAQNQKRAETILEETYRRAPHPDLFRAALDLEPPGAEVRLKRAKTIAALAPSHVESAIGLARAALSAREPETARNALSDHIEDRPTQRVCIVMAELEALAPGDEGRVRHWLTRAVRAPKDPQWIADGVIAAAWAPISPVTGRLDAFEWQVPPTIGEPPVPSIDLDELIEPHEPEALPPGPSVPKTI